jgi:hypothetical protein
MTEPRADLVVHPKAKLSGLGVLTFVITIVPLFAVLYWYTAALDIWRVLLAIQLVLSVGGVGAFFRQRRVFTAVSDTHLWGNGIFSATSTVPLDGVERIVMVDVYRNHPNETTTQFLAVGEQNRALFRMRGQFWNESDLLAAAAATRKPLHREKSAISEEEFFSDYPGSAYWFEKRKGTAVAIVAAVIAVGGIAAVLALENIPATL